MDDGGRAPRALTDRSASAGSITSRVDEQDAVGVLVALRLLSGSAVADVHLTDPAGSVIHAEGRDDLEVVTRNSRILVSVKALNADLSTVRHEYLRLRARAAHDAGRRCSLGVALVGPQAEAITKLETQSNVAREMLRHRDNEEQEELRAAYQERWPQLPRTFIEDGYVMTNFPRLHSESYIAEASRLLRRIAPLTDYTDIRTDLIVSDLTAKMSAARHNRGSVTFTELRDSIYSQALPLDTVTIPHTYVRTRFGYVSNPLLERSLEREQRDVRSAVRGAMKRYRRATRAHRFKAVGAGPVRCIACNGPLMANIIGYTRQGIACAHCGFTPFVSLFYACTCGSPILLVAQPPTELVEMTRAIREALYSASCENCGQTPMPERLQTRIFQLNIAWPPESYSDNQLIEAREEFGWKGGSRFRDGSGRALDVLLAEALAERERGKLGAPST